MTSGSPPAGSAAFAVLRDLLDPSAGPSFPPLVPIRHRAVDAATAHDGGDYDVLSPDDGFPVLLGRIADLCRPAGVSFTVEHLNPAKRRIQLHAPEAATDIILEVWSHLEVRDPAGASAGAIPWTALTPRLLETPAGPRLPPRLEALYYLSHLGTKRKDPAHPEVRRRLGHYRDSDSEAGKLCERLIAGEGIPAVAAEANRLLRHDGVLAAGSWDERLRQARASRIRHRRRRIAQRRILAFTGPDGVGKTTVIDALRADLACHSTTVRFKNLFRHHPFYRVLWWLRYPAARRANGGTLEKNEFDEQQAASLFGLARSAWPWLRLRAAILGVQCCDRFYHDLLFAPLRRGRAAGLRHGWERDARRMPLPGWHLHLDAPDEVIRGRKQELDASAIAACREGLRTIHLAVGTPYYTCLSTARPIDELRIVLRRAGACLGLGFAP